MPKREDWVPAEMPEGSNPEEFMNDEALAKWHAERHAALDDDDPAKADAALAVKRAKIAAAITAAVDPDVA